MARLPRLFIKDCPQHIIQRGNNRQATFFADEDYTVYLDRLKDFTKKEIILPPKMASGFTEPLQSSMMAVISKMYNKNRQGDAKKRRACCWS
jgi:hypothetical protein